MNRGQDFRTIWEEINKSLGSLSEKIILKTILNNLSDRDVRKFLLLLENKRYEEMDSIISSKIPDFDKKVEEEHKRQTSKILGWIRDDGSS